MTDIAARAIDDLSIDRMTLVGASLGSAVALTYAVRHPGRVSTLVLSGAPTMAGNAELGIASFGKLTRTVAEASADRLFHDRRRLPDGLLERAYRTFIQKRAFVNMIRLMRASETFDSATPLGLVDVDTLMIWGEQDRISRVSDWRRLLPRARRGTFVTIAECGHSPMLERPAEFNAILLEHLRAPGR
jgi:pimeloyl-ACP methyl ester carboxylesterase